MSSNAEEWKCSDPRTPNYRFDWTFKKNVLRVLLFLNRSYWVFCAVCPSAQSTKNTTAGCGPCGSVFLIFYFCWKRGQQLNWRTAGCKMQVNQNAELVFGLNAFARIFLGWSAPTGFSCQFSRFLWSCKLCSNCNCKSWMGVGYNLGCSLVVQV